MRPCSGCWPGPGSPARTSPADPLRAAGRRRGGLLGQVGLDGLGQLLGVIDCSQTWPGPDIWASSSESPNSSFLAPLTVANSSGISARINARWPGWTSIDWPATKSCSTISPDICTHAVRFAAESLEDHAAAAEDPGAQLLLDADRDLDVRGAARVGVGLDHVVVGRVDPQLADDAGEPGREGHEPTVRRRGVLGEEQLAAAEDPLQAAHEPPRRRTRTASRCPCRNRVSARRPHRPRR